MKEIIKKVGANSVGAVSSYLAKWKIKKII